MTNNRYLHRKPPDDEDEEPSSPGRHRAPKGDRSARPGRRPRDRPRARPTRGTPEAPVRGRPAPGDQPPASEGPRGPTYRPHHYVLLGAIVLLGLILRLRDPLASSVIGAEDPYLHMERTWNLLQGQGVSDYPIGFMVLLAPFAMAGEQTFYYAVRFLPPFLGAAAVATTFFLCRPFLHAAGTLTATLLVAVMPEHIMRTTLMFPTALDLTILPILALAVLRIPDAARWSYWTAAALVAGLLFIHPWAVGLLVPVVGTFLLLVFLRRSDHASWATAAGAGTAVLLVGVLWFLPVWTPAELASEAVPQAEQLLADPGSARHAPEYVNLPWMLTWPALALAAIGVVVAAWRRTDFAILAALWSLMMLPIVLVDWFGVWYLPHRTVAFMSIGVVMLAGLAVSEGVRQARAADVKVIRVVPLAVLVVVAILALPTTAAMDGWYRLYDEDDYAAWDTLDAKDPSLVVTGSWQARAGYRGLTGQPAVFNPQFFHDQATRDHDLAQHPDLIVLVDPYTIEENHLPTDFLHDWELVGEWGDTKAYQKPNGDNTS